MDALVRHIQTIPPSQWCQAYFITLGCGCLALQAMPRDVQHALLGYGARKSEDEKDGKSPSSSRLVNLLDRLKILQQVPHAWFTHFYIALIAFQLFWAAQFLYYGRVMTSMANLEMQLGSHAKSMDVPQLVTVWGMLLFQACRRTWECATVMKPSNSPMLAIHWIMTMIFYFGMSISIWIEGSATIVGYPFTTTSLCHFPGLIMLLWCPLYLASATQSRCHMHLASLAKYSLPHEGLFKHLVCPHYTMECIIYLILALAATPCGYSVNRTILASLFFVVANLGTTARNTELWYVEKFGPEKVPRWNMIPFVF